MTTIISPTNAARPTRGRRLAAASLLAAALALGGSGLLHPAIAAAAPPVTPVTPAPGPGSPVVITPALPPGTGPSETDRGWDIEQFDQCMERRQSADSFCCENSGGVWANGKCQAPPAQNAQ